MNKTILITGATDGIGLQTARMLAPAGHQLLLHGRNPVKLDKVVAEVSALPGAGPVERYVADLSDLGAVEAMAEAVIKKHGHLGVLINNAGVLKTANPTTADGLDIRFVVNTLAPYLLTRRLLAVMNGTSRVINVSSAAQAPVNTDAMSSPAQLPDMDAYAQSKLAITMWSRHLADELGPEGPVVVAVNPASLLGTKMVKAGFGIDGNDISVGADILIRAALSDEFADASGKYYDNDAKRFAPPHADALDAGKRGAVMDVIESLLADAAGR
ncbi:MAG: SDR family NAD(P)-dependent oxidoreductase [Nannocystaceae bacterium]|nr:SDR family NAD(P)-dependent oxidoreductase [bacterium]